MELGLAAVLALPRLCFLPGSCLDGSLEAGVPVHERGSELDGPFQPQPLCNSRALGSPRG